MEASLKTFSPKELAQAVGVSESSIKRWVDDGRIAVMRTAGGHRRILLGEAVRFVRDQGMRVLRPDLLGLPDLADLPPEARQGDFTGEVLFELLRRGEAARVRGIIAGRYLNGLAPAALFDGPMAEALRRLGALWHQSEEGIYLEHMATSICIEAVNQLRLLMPSVSAGAPVALGGSPSGDPYLLPSLMAATVLAEAGYADVNLGPDTPAAAFLHAAEVHRPRLVWVALTSHFAEGQVAHLADQLLAPLCARGIDVVVGGAQAVAHRAQWPSGVHVMISMADLAAHAARRAT